ncbi:hypothetical protein BDK51DRAFT_25768 [Blyttiomyces helicus]|uniref:Uncharacterized protein n=1 Tax=Blyttiomyces helicus TaxID=388810 RepID=A0A4P9WJ14_9FUNG|nr:hypothetical protein BDK51DRAFT_25768 [Blyttiomyces helicus]|eukprot:RKO91913.1 hypothetical protein BDK51DRAFT_25768 [Blyttiomyces helicus]
MDWDAAGGDLVHPASVIVASPQSREAFARMQPQIASLQVALWKRGSESAIETRFGKPSSQVKRLREVQLSPHLKEEMQVAGRGKGLVKKAREMRRMLAKLHDSCFHLGYGTEKKRLKEESIGITVFLWGTRQKTQDVDWHTAGGDLLSLKLKEAMQVVRHGRRLAKKAREKGMMLRYKFLFPSGTGDRKKVRGTRRGIAGGDFEHPAAADVARRQPPDPGIIFESLEDAADRYLVHPANVNVASRRSRGPLALMQILDASVRIGDRDEIREAESRDMAKKKKSMGHTTGGWGVIAGFRTFPPTSLVASQRCSLQVAGRGRRLPKKACKKRGVWAYIVFFWAARKKARLGAPYRYGMQLVGIFGTSRQRPRRQSPVTSPGVLPPPNGGPDMCGQWTGTAVMGTSAADANNPNREATGSQAMQIQTYSEARFGSQKKQCTSREDVADVVDWQQDYFNLALLRPKKLGTGPTVWPQVHAVKTSFMSIGRGINIRTSKEIPRASSVERIRSLAPSGNLYHVPRSTLPPPSNTNNNRHAAVKYTRTDGDLDPGHRMGRGADQKTKTFAACWGMEETMSWVSTKVATGPDASLRNRTFTILQTSAAIDAIRSLLRRSRDVADDCLKMPAKEEPEWCMANAVFIWDYIAWIGQYRGIQTRSATGGSCERSGVAGIEDHVDADRGEARWRAGRRSNGTVAEQLDVLHKRTYRPAVLFGHGDSSARCTMSERKAGREDWRWGPFLSLTDAKILFDKTSDSYRKTVSQALRRALGRHHCDQLECVLQETFLFGAVHVFSKLGRGRRGEEGERRGKRNRKKRAQHSQDCTALRTTFGFARSGRESGSFGVSKTIWPAVELSRQLELHKTGFLVQCRVGRLETGGMNVVWIVDGAPSMPTCHRLQRENPRPCPRLTSQDRFIRFPRRLFAPH